MTHPDKYGVGLLTLSMVTFAFLILFGVSLLAIHNAHRVLPANRFRTTYWIGMVLMVPLWIAIFPLAPRVSQAVAVIASFGWDAYDGGLRVVNRHCQLSDGRFLSVFWAAAAHVGCMVLDFCWVIPVAAWHYHFNPRPPALNLTNHRRGTCPDSCDNGGN